MTRNEMEKSIAKKMDTTMVEAGKFYDAFIDTVTEFCGDFEADDQRVVLPNFGIINVTRKEAYVSRNPRTGEPVEVDESRRVTFKAAKPFKDAVNAIPEKKAKKASTKKAPAKKVTTVAKKSAVKKGVKKVVSKKK